MHATTLAVPEIAWLRIIPLGQVELDDPMMHIPFASLHLRCSLSISFYSVSASLQISNHPESQPGR
jgi:hypothetical protein